MEAPAAAAAGPKIEEKLFQNRYRVDSTRPHISIVDEAVCADRCSTKACTSVCPAGCWTREGNGRVTLATDGCLECGTCRVVCDEYRNVAWDYPRGGYGILFKFG
jgi:ferredoxin like protein